MNLRHSGRKRIVRLPRVLVAAWMAVAWIAAAADDATPKPPPNIVMIVSDDHLWSDYGFMGNPDVRTPNLDRLAAESRCFPRGYVTSSLCCPSLATIITGKYPHVHGVTGNDPPRPAGMSPAEFRDSPAFQEGRRAMSAGLAAAGPLPARLAARGYLSLQTGKWWQNEYAQGGFTHGMTAGFRHGDKGLEIGRHTMQPIYDFLAEARRRAKPFLVWYAPMLPHQPHNPPKRILAKYRDDATPLPVAKYRAMVEWFDETCGTLLDRLDADGLRDNTIVVFLADNGWITDPATGDYDPRSKQSQYDGGLRTPILLRWPGVVSPGKRTEPAQSIDLVPTLLHAAGAEVPDDLPGIDLLDDTALARRTEIFGECFTHDVVDARRPAAGLKWRWIVRGRHKLIVPDPANRPDDPVELYDLTDDPAEHRNLAPENPDLVRDLTTRLDAWWKP